MLRSFARGAFLISLFSLISCAPAQNKTGSVKLSFSQSSFANSGLISDSTALSNDFCYALYVTGEGLGTPDSGDVEKDCAGSGGRVVGLFGRQAGNTEVSVENLPAGRNYRFDLLGIRKSHLTAEGFDCSSKLTIRFTPSLNGGQDTEFQLTRAGQAAPVTIPEPPLRYFARGEVVVSTGENTVILNRTNEKPLYDVLSAAESATIGTAFTCQMESKVFPWSRKALATELVTPFPGDAAHGTIFTSSEKPMMRVSCPSDVDGVEIYVIEGTNLSNVVASSGRISCSPSNPAIYTWTYDLSTANAKVDPVTSHVRFFGGGALKDLQSNRWIYNPDENIKTIQNAVLGNQNLNAGSAKPTVAGILNGHMLLTTNGVITKVPLVLNNGFPYPYLFGAPIAANNTSTGTFLDLTGTTFGSTTYALNPSNNYLFELGAGHARTVNLSNYIGSTNGYTGIADYDGPTALDGDLLFQATTEPFWVFKNSTPDSTNFQTSTAESRSVPMINNLPAIDVGTATEFDGIAARLFKAANGNFSIFALTQDVRGRVAVGACQNYASMLGGGGCAANISPEAITTDGNSAAHGTAATTVKHITEVFNHRGSLRALRIIEDIQPNGLYQLIKYLPNQTPAFDVEYGAITTSPAWQGQIQFMKAIPYRAETTQGIVASDQNQLIAGGWTTCNTFYHCAVIYRSLDSGLTWTRTYLGPQGSEMREAHIFEIPATYNLNRDRNNYRHSALFLQVDPVSGNISVLIQPPNSNGF